jgi:RHS repeat-associated protein
VYDAFGSIQSGNTLSQPYAFTGREYDAETGLYYYRARYYDPQVGRFISRDPLGFGGGDVNVYAYVKNRPTVLRDPLGLYGESWDPEWPENTTVIQNPPTSSKICYKNCDKARLLSCTLRKVAEPDPDKYRSCSICIVSKGTEIGECLECGGNIIAGIPDSYQECKREACEIGTYNEQCGRCQ